MNINGNNKKIIFCPLLLSYEIPNSFIKSPIDKTDEFFFSYLANPDLFFRPFLTLVVRKRDKKEAFRATWLVNRLKSSQQRETRCASVARESIHSESGAQGAGKNNGAYQPLFLSVRETL